MALVGDDQIEGMNRDVQLLGFYIDGLVGAVELVDCIRYSNSIWAIDNYWHWVLRDPRPYSRSRPAKGSLGLWEWAR